MFRRRAPWPPRPPPVDVLHTVSRSDLGVFALGLVIAGAVSGLAAGVLGVGGGVVIVPVLYHVMTALGVDAGVRMPMAIGTSAAAMIPAALTHVQNNRIGRPQLRTALVAVSVGAAAGAAAAAFAGGIPVASVFAMAAAPVVYFLAMDRPLAATIDAGKESSAFAALAGFAAAMTGIAAGTIRRAVLGDENRARAAALTLAAAIVGTIALVVAGWNVPTRPPESAGYVNLLAFALIAPVLVATEPAGAALAHLMDLRRLRIVFAVLIAIATARMLWDALW